MIVAILLLPALVAGCGNASHLAEAPRPDIGEPPTYLQEVPAPPWRAGRSVYVVAAELEAALDKANVIIRCDRAEWIATRATLQRDRAAIENARRAGEQCVLDAAVVEEPKQKRPRGLRKRSRKA